MAFKLVSVLDSIDDLPDSIDPRTLYTEKDGKFELVGEGIKTPADIERLNKALKKERDEHKATKGKVAAYGDWTLEAIEELEERAVTAEAATGGKGRPSQEAIDKVVAVQVEKLKRDHDKIVKGLTEQITTLTGENVNLMGEKKKRTLRDSIADVTKGEKGIKIRPEALEDVEIYAERVFEFGEDGKPVTREGVGVEPGLSPRELITNIQVGGNKPHWFEETSGAGAGGGNGPKGGPKGGPNVFDKATFNYGAASAMMKQDPIRAKRLIETAKDPSQAKLVFAHALTPKA